MTLLGGVLEAEEKTALWRLYMAKIGEGICSALGYRVTSYEELAGLKKADTRTGDQIMDDVMKQLEQLTGREG